MSRRRATILAWTLSALTSMAAAGTITLAVLGDVFGEGVDALPFYVSCALIGSLIASRQPGNMVGWVMLVGGLSFMLMTFTGYYALYGIAIQPGALPGARAVAWPQTWLWVPGAACLYLLLPFYFPDGRPVSPRWRWFPPVVIAGAVALATVSSLTPGEELIQVHANQATVVNPLGIDDDAPAVLLRVLDVAIPVLLVGLAVTATASLLIRFRRSQRVERQQLKWVAYAFVAFLALIVLDPLIGIPAEVGGLYLLCIPAAVGIAMLRYNLYDIDLIINRTLVYGALTASVIGIYIFVVGYLGSVFQRNANPSDLGWPLTISLVATGIVAVFFQPIRDQLQRGVNRLMYGERDDPYAVLSRLGARLEATLAPEAVLPTIVETVREALKLPYAAITFHESQQPVTAAASGSLRGTPLRITLTHQREPIGELVLGPRASGETFGPSDQRLLADLARHIGAAVHNVRLAHQMLHLNADLQRSRQQLVLSREEERRRLRRELHDGLAPTLAALNLKAGTVRGLLRSDPDAAEAVLDEWRSELRTTIGSIRQLAYELRPPILDQLGLVAAIQERAAQIHSAQCQVTVDAADSFGPLPAAVEVAAFRIVLEALTNVDQHAQARDCRVRLWRCEGPPDSLCVEVVDDGVGMPHGPTHQSGVGLLSMHERAAELGGTCVIERRGPSGGTRLVAQLPIVAE
ncbi:MAG: histidine kinase [Chloroflexota bacterium]|nr:histidine kinase [Chloroflexota bacterium]